MSKPIKSSRSGGPRTEAGKAVSARNSTKVGIYSHQIILPGEDPEAFAELESLFVADFMPVGVTEASLVRELAVLTWKKYRLERVERRQSIDYLKSPVQVTEWPSLSIPKGDDFAKIVLEVDQIDDSDIDGLRQSLDVIYRFLKSKVQVADLVAVQSEAPAVFQLVMTGMAEYGHDDMSPNALIRLEHQQRNNGKEVGSLYSEFIDLKETLGQKLWLAENKAMFAEAHARLTNNRLATRICSERYERAYDHLSRSFYKTLSELRKQQAWRREREVIDVTPEPVGIAA
jgi:hypothetical protein